MAGHAQEGACPVDCCRVNQVPAECNFLLEDGMKAMFIDALCREVLDIFCLRLWHAQHQHSGSAFQMQEAGDKLADPSWRVRPALLPTFGCASDHEATPPSTPGQSQPSSPLVPNGNHVPNGSPASSFRFGVPSSKYLSFAGPGGDSFEAGTAAMSQLCP
jgi:hypothetical protein